MSFFEIVKQSKKSRARIGIIHTSHGDIQTPSFVPVATKGTLKTIPPKDLPDIGIQVAFVNTFHLSMHPGVEIVQKMGGIHEYANLSIPLMSDSAGFQVFSLASLACISDEGVKFHSPFDGKEIWFTPEISMKNQEMIGADLLMAFDECISATSSHAYTKEATERTHDWLLRCIETLRLRSGQAKNKQKLYGIVQGGQYKDLRIFSAKFVAKQRIDGVAIGGVSVGETKKQMRDQVTWTVSYLPNELPRHLLGVGRIDDILDLVVLGIDTFDCVEPSRLARNGVVLERKGKKFERIDLAKTKYRNTAGPIQKECLCYACKNFSLSFLHHLFRERELLGYYLATYHNLFQFEQLFAEIRENIKKGTL